ncbi:hypothetical protein ABT160_02020 [Streptomyces sp. NPDC001941]|uniref:hypothetical protein n=1 Tax=Streptomyces sp. NPDC001941 TaxID=3154659 RepID=UPI0033309A83
MTTLELVPGMITTREDVAAVYGGSVYSGGIVPAPKSDAVFVYSDPAAGAKHGYTFDGWAEADELGPLFLYTGAGGTGHQEMVRGNKTLMETRDNGRVIHLFVAAGRVKGKKLMTQRYVGRVKLDETEPVVERQAPDSNGDMRSVYVFRMRPAMEGLVVTGDDVQPPANEFSQIELPKKPKISKVPKQPGAKDKKTENHTTKQTTANVNGGPKEVFRREGELCTAFEAYLEGLGHICKSFQITVPGEPGTFTPDLYDETDNVLYEGKGQATRNNVRTAIGQLLDYRRHIKAKTGMRLAVLLPDEPTADVRALLDSVEIGLVTQTPDGGFAGLPTPAQQA